MFLATVAWDLDAIAPFLVVIQEMSLEMHYNDGADLLTYLVDPAVFKIENGYVEALQGASHSGIAESTGLIVETTAGPGLGIEVNETLVREMSAQYADKPAWRNAVWTGPDGALREW